MMQRASVSMNHLAHLADTLRQSVTEAHTSCLVTRRTGCPRLQSAASYLAAAVTPAKCFAKNASVFGQESRSASAR